jgi:hypothetical protein
MGKRRIGPESNQVFVLRFQSFRNEPKPVHVERANHVAESQGRLASQIGQFPERAASPDGCELWKGTKKSIPQFRFSEGEEKKQNRGGGDSGPYHMPYSAVLGSLPGPGISVVLRNRTNSSSSTRRLVGDVSVSVSLSRALWTPALPLVPGWEAPWKGPLESSPGDTAESWLDSCANAITPVAKRRPTWQRSHRCGMPEFGRRLRAAGGAPGYRSSALSTIE